MQPLYHLDPSPSGVSQNLGKHVLREQELGRRPPRFFLAHQGVIT